MVDYVWFCNDGESYKLFFETEENEIAYHYGDLAHMHTPNRRMDKYLLVSSVGRRYGIILDRFEFTYGVICLNDAFERCIAHVPFSPDLGTLVRSVLEVINHKETEIDTDELFEILGLEAE